MVSENNGKSHSPNVINIDLESDSSGQQTTGSGRLGSISNQSNIMTKSITIGELTDSIIAKDFSSNPLSCRPYIPYPSESMEQWKRRKDEQQQQQQQQQPQQQQNKNQMGRVTPDERQILRMAQPASPRKGNMYHEPVSPVSEQQQQQHFITGDRRQQQPNVPPVGEFQLDRYMSNKIVEAMRTSDEKSRIDENNSREQRESLGQQQQNKEIDRSSTPGEMIIDEERGGGISGGINLNSDHDTTIQYSSSQQPQQQQPQPQAVTTFATTTYAYPFSALNVNSGAAVALTSQQSISTTKLSNLSNQENDTRPPPIQLPLAEPKPLLSAQYEALSDED